MVSAEKAKELAMDIYREQKAQLQEEKEVWRKQAQMNAFKANYVLSIFEEPVRVLTQHLADIDLDAAKDEDW